MVFRKQPNALFLIIVALIAVLPFAVAGTQQQQTVRQHAADLSPSATPTYALPTPILTLVPTFINLGATPTVSIRQPGTAAVTVIAQLHGIGQAGDAVNPANHALSNKTPRERERVVSLVIVDGSGQTVLEPAGVLNYAPETGDFRGTISLGSGFTPGNYTVKVRMKKYLIKKAADSFAIRADATNILPTITLAVGDVDANNSIDVMDYNAVLACFTHDINIKKCEETQQLKSDLNDDGAINILDSNLLLREFAAGKGD